LIQAHHSLTTTALDPLAEASTARVTTQNSQGSFLDQAIYPSSTPDPAEKLILRIPTP